MISECTPRGGCPNIFSRLQQNKNINIAYFGGSITEQSGWRVQTLNWFRQTYPQLHIKEINAAIGGTGSEIGVFRMDHDVLSQKPNLIFIEFAVNDSYVESDEIVRSMEGIVRKTWKQFPECDLCFVYTLMQSLLPELTEGRLYRSAEVMERIADHYRIPSIFMGFEVVRLEKEGRLVMCEPESLIQHVAGCELNLSSPLPVNEKGKIVFSPDGIHPYKDTGHRLYTEAILRSLPIIEKVSCADHSRRTPSPMMADNLENAKMIPITEARMTGPWQKLNRVSAGGRSFRRFLNELWSGDAGAELSFRFRGRRVLIYDLLGPDGCLLQISVDGLLKKTMRFDGFCIYHRLSALNVCNTTDSENIHTIQIKVLPERIDKEHILFEHHRNDLHEHPEKYRDQKWHAAGIFLDGEICV